MTENFVRLFEKTDHYVVDNYKPFHVLDCNLVTTNGDTVLALCNRNGKIFLLRFSVDNDCDGTFYHIEIKKVSGKIFEWWGITDIKEKVNVKEIAEIQKRLNAKYDLV